MFSSIDANHPVCIGCAYLLLLFSVCVPCDGYSEYRHGECRWLSRHVNFFCFIYSDSEWGRKKKHCVRPRGQTCLRCSIRYLPFCVWGVGLNQKDLNSKRLRLGPSMRHCHAIEWSVAHCSLIQRNRNDSRFIRLFEAIRLICSEIERF